MDEQLVVLRSANFGPQVKKMMKVPSPCLYKGLCIVFVDVCDCLAHAGLAHQLVADPSGQHWLAQGTSRGWVCLWDARFLICVNSWQHPQR
jgi:hypothetical protein